MYRLLIVDDEPVIVNGLVQLFQEYTEIELDIRKAYSSSEALAIAQKTKLDIMVSDIRMPQKSGLQLVDEIVYYWPSCRIIFLTGYSEFEYVYEAIRKNVDNYILKTEGIEPIFQAVKTAVSKLEEENRRRLQLEKAQMYLGITNSFLKKELIDRVLNGESITLLLEDARYSDIDFGIVLDRPSFFVVGVVDQLTEPKFKLPQSVQRIFLEHLPASIACEEVSCEERVLIWLLQPDEGLLHRFRVDSPDLQLNWHGIVTYMKGVLELVQNECEQVLGVNVSFGVSGDLLHQWESLHLQIEAVRAMIVKRTSLEQPMLILDLEKLSQLEDTLHKSGGIEQEEFKSILIDRVHQYVLDNLSGDVSLTSIAEEVYLNPSYLSRYYKQITGQNLLEYIQSTKLHVAIQLMENTNLKLNEIAIRVGFESPSYFTTFFKRKTGLSPQEYRKQK